MKLADLCEDISTLSFPKLGKNAHPERDAVLIARSRLAVAVSDDEFLVDCICYDLHRLKRDYLPSGLAPFYVMPILGLRFAFGYWPPGVSSGPHEHTAWTITAVCRNELEVLTFDREKSYSQKSLVPKKKIKASAGQTGFIYEPCIHDVTNTSANWSLSLHVSSPRDGELLNDFDPLPCLSVQLQFAQIPQHHPYSRVVSVRRKQRLVWQLAQILSSISTPQALDALTSCYHLACTSTRRLLGYSVENALCGQTDQTNWILQRTHKDLILVSKWDDDEVLLEAQTPSGFSKELVVNSVARDAVVFAASKEIFDLHELPGSLSDDERFTIGEALEETGLFQRIWQ